MQLMVEYLVNRSQEQDKQYEFKNAVLPHIERVFEIHLRHRHTSGISGLPLLLARVYNLQQL